MGPTEDFGRSSPLGATPRDGGVTFSLYSRNASRVELLFFDHEDDAKPARVISINLNDLVSYNSKHNEANGEENRDGCNDDYGWNCGVEGPTGEAAIEKLRNRQVKNFLATTLFSLGMPMLLMGDEVRRTQAGNNNAYCQDNDTSWFDWNSLERHADIFRFVRLLIHGRLRRVRTTKGAV